jgi:hypothetical protein
MKNIIIILLLITFSLSCYSQSKIFNTKIEKAAKVEIKGGKAEIKNVENLTIGIINIQDVKPKYYFSELFRQKDSKGIYTTQIILKHSGNPDNIYVNFGLEFDKPVNSVETHFNVGSNISETFGDNNTWYTFKGFVQSTENVINIIIKSNSPVFTKISGVSANQN